MRVTYRHQNNEAYWADRWDKVPADVEMSNVDAYPLKYALETVVSSGGAILEAGCGAGRVVRYFHNRGFEIVGVDFIEAAIDKLRSADPSLKVEKGDIAKLRFENNSFRYLLAFGLYHNLEDNLDAAVAETWRVLEPGGRLCASFRADNLQTRLTDLLAKVREPKEAKSGTRLFHKRNLTRRELRHLFERAHFEVESVTPAENMPILYKFAWFRAKDHKSFNENRARSEGYLLSPAGSFLQRLIMRFFPNQFCNIYVLIATKT